MRTIVVLMGLFLAFAGCADDASPASASPTPSTFAPEPTVDATTGSLTGLVTDEELQPLPKARVSIVETAAEQTADAEGRFTFNQLEPGDYRIVAEGLGFESQGKKVTIVAGETATANFTLKSIVDLQAEAHHLSIPRVSLIQVSNSVLSIATNYSAVCGSCYHTLHFEPVPLQVIVENMWTSTEAGPINAAVDIWWRYYDKSEAYHNHLATYGNRERVAVPEVEVNELAGSKVDSFAITVEGDVLSVQHRVDTWHTFAYGAVLPDDFSALPP